MKTYPVLSPISAGKNYRPGDSIELEDKDAAELLACGAVGPAESKGERSGTKSAPKA